mgnify:CR=1 FL=1
MMTIYRIMYKVVFTNIVRYEKMFDDAGEFVGYDYGTMLEPPTMTFADIDEYRNWARNSNNRKRIMAKWQ